MSLLLFVRVGPQAIGVLWDYMICSVGKELSGCSTKLDTPDENGEGEVRKRYVAIALQVPLFS